MAQASWAISGIAVGPAHLATPAQILALWAAERDGWAEDAWQPLADGAVLERKRRVEKTSPLHEAARGGQSGSAHPPTRQPMVQAAWAISGGAVSPGSFAWTHPLWTPLHEAALGGHYG